MNEVYVDTNETLLLDYDEGMKLFDLKVFNKVIDKSNILLYFPNKITNVKPEFVKGFSKYWLDNYSVNWIINNVTIYPLRLEEQFYAGLV